MTPGIRQLVWEQARQSMWMIFALATGVLPCWIAQIILRVEDSVPRLREVFFLKEDEAIHLCDIWVCISCLAVIFGMLMSQERKSEFSIGLPTRLLRLPVPSPLLATMWVGSRTIFASCAIAAMLAFRQRAIHGQTELPFAPAFAFLAGGCFVAMGVVRLAEAWSEKAAWTAVFLVFAMGGVLKDRLWESATMDPHVFFGACVLIGLETALAGFGLRRRGGVFSGLKLLSLRQGAQYKRIADIPRFASQEDAQTWWEWRFSGRVFPALVFAGCCIATGPLVLDPVLRPLGVKLSFDIRDAFYILLGVPLWSATITSIQLAARSAFRRDRPQGRFLRVRPMSGWSYSVARHRMLRRSAALGLAFVPVFLVAGIVHWVMFLPPDHLGASDHQFAASEVVRSVENLLFPQKYSFPGYVLTRGDASEALVTCAGYGLIFAALLIVANGVLPLMILLTILAITMVAGLTQTHYNLDVVFNVLPMLLACLAIAQAVYVGVVSLRRGLVFITVGLLLTCITTMLGGNSLMSIAPFGLICAILAGAMPSVALAHHAARVADCRPARLANAHLDWHDAWGFLQVAAAIALVLLALVGTWRWTVRESVRLEVARANEQGIPPLPDYRDPMEISGQAKKGGQPDLVSAELNESNAHLRALIAACTNLRMQIHIGPRAFRLDGPNPQLSTEAEGVPLEDVAGFPPKAASLLEQLQSQVTAFRAAGAAVTAKDLATTGNLDLLRCAMQNWLGLAMYDAAMKRQETQADLQYAVALYKELWEKERRNKDYTRYRSAWYVGDDNAPAALGIATEFVLQHTALPLESIVALEAALPRERHLDEYRESFRPVSYHDYALTYEYSYGRSYELNFLGDIPLGKSLAPEIFLTPSASYAAYVHEMSNEFMTHARCFETKSPGGIGFSHRRREQINTYIPFATEESSTPAETHRVLHRVDGTLSLLRQVLILEQFRIKHGTYPEQLQDCIPELVAKSPVDWSRFGLQLPFGYERFSPTSCKVWAAGDGYDNRGLRHSYEGEGGTDIVIHLNRAQ